MKNLRIGTMVLVFIISYAEIAGADVSTKKVSLKTFHPIQRVEQIVVDGHLQTWTVGSKIEARLYMDLSDMRWPDIDHLKIHLKGLCKRKISQWETFWIWNNGPVIAVSPDRFPWVKNIQWSDVPDRIEARVSSTDNRSRHNFHEYVQIDCHSYQDNAERLHTNYSITESTLIQINELFQHVQELAIQAANGAITNEARSHIADQVHQLGLQLETLSNTELDGEYIFSGLMVDTKPFTLSAAYPDSIPAATYFGDSKVMRLEVAPEISLEMNIPGDSLFQGDGTPNTVDLFQVMADTEVAIRNGLIHMTDTNGVPEQLERVRIAQNQVVGFVALIGERASRLEAMQEHPDHESKGH